MYAEKLLPYAQCVAFRSVWQLVSSEEPGEPVAVGGVLAEEPVHLSGHGRAGARSWP